MSYRDMVTVEGEFNVPEIMRHAHRKARHARHIDICCAAARTDIPRGTAPGDYHLWYAKTAATIDRHDLDLASYAKLFADELRQAWSWARAIRGAGQGEAPGRAVPMFKAA